MVNTRLRFSCVLLLLLAGCGVQKYLKRGDEALARGDYTQAIEAYEEALRVEPGHGKAHERIREARRLAVRGRLTQAEAALSSGELAAALRNALAARRMPLDLEDVDLVRSIDATIDRAAQLAEERVQKSVERGHFVAAVDLSQQIVDASPGVSSRRQWGDEVRSKAVEYYLGQARALGDQGLFGSSAIQLAMAKRVGAPVAVADVQKLWNRFAEPTCFAKPTVSVVDRANKAGELVNRIESTAQKELEELRGRCGEGTRKLGVQIELEKVELVDDTKTERAAQALPGYNIKTEEVYVEEEPYTAIEEVTEYTTRTEKQERRDCAPRPGKERGCVTWVEDVEVKVPKVTKREVQKVRKVEKKRPVKGPLPADKVLAYDVTTVTRRVVYEGKVTVTGEASTTRKFAIRRDASDSSHERAEAPKLTIEADPLEVKPMADITAQAADAVAQEVRGSVAEAVKAWANTHAEAAHKQVVSGQLPQAEELYLRMLALGSDGGAELVRFFEDRYGESVGQVMDVVTLALGHAVEEKKAGEGEAASSTRFPHRATGGGDEPGEEPEAPPVTEVTRAPVKVPVRVDDRSTEKRLSDDELKSLEQESIDVVGGKPVQPQPPAAGEEQKAAPAPAPSADAGDRKPVPIKPK